MRIIKVKQNQSIADVALQEYGTIDGIKLIVQDNPQLSGPTANLFLNDELSIRDQPLNKPMQTELIDTDIETVKGARGTGIGYMKIGTDFIVG